MDQIDSVMGQNKISISQKSELKDILIDPNDSRFINAIHQFELDKDKDKIRTFMLALVSDFSPMEHFEETYSLRSEKSQKEKSHRSIHMNTPTISTSIGRPLPYSNQKKRSSRRDIDTKSHGYAPIYCDHHHIRRPLKKLNKINIESS